MTMGHMTMGLEISDKQIDELKAKGEIVHEDHSYLIIRLKKEE